MKEACSCQEAITPSLEACIAGDLTKKQGLYSILAVVTKETEPTSRRFHECACTRAGMNAHARVHSSMHARVH